MRRLLTSASRVLVFLSLLGYGLLCQALLGLAHFVYAVPYLALLVVPIPVLLPLWLVSGRLRTAYLYLQLFGLSVQMVVRVLLDLWLPV